MHTMRVVLHVSLVALLSFPGRLAQPLASCPTAADALAGQLQLPATQLPSCVQLSDAIALRWGIQRDVITFGLQAQLAPGTAYLGIGLSELGSMKGADIALFNTTASCKWTLVDAYAPGFMRPVADQLQSTKLLGVRHSNGSLVAAWQRRLAPCDQQDLPIGSLPLHVIWAHGSSWGYHGSANRGSRLVSFLDQQLPVGSAEPVVTASEGPADSSTASNATGNVRVLELAFPVPIPEQTTTYWVHYFELPSDRKYHIIKYEPIAHSPLLHHGVAYSCTANQSVAVGALPNLGPYDRFKTKMLCEQFYMLVTPNTSYTLPANVGLPMGTSNTQYVAMELHYNNPDNLANLSDVGSGLRVYYTEQLRPHDMGLLTLQQPVINIPTGQATVPGNVSVCPGSCTGRFPGPVTLVDGLFHMHGTGKSIITRRYRNGLELPPIGQLRSFDYAFQGATPIGPESRTLLPGDALTLQCTFDSTDRTNWTRGGVATQDEMCFHWIFYYPADEDMNMCFTFGTTPAAVCGATYPPQLQAINETNAGTMVPQLIQQGSLLFAPDPANSSTHYREVCNPSPVV